MSRFFMRAVNPRVSEICRFILAALGLCTGLANATPITYIEQATTTGSLAGVAFTNKLTTITLVGDTANVTGIGVFTNSIGTFTFSISGVGSGTFTDSLFVLDNQTFTNASFSDGTQNKFILGTTAAIFASYDLRSAIGPITGAVTANNPIGTFPTTGGTLVLTSASGNSTFTAITTPEPISTALVGIGLAVLGVRRRRNPKCRA